MTQEYDETDYDRSAPDPEPAHQQMGWLDALNPMQRQAVEMPEGHCLIIAGAGSGKTKVLTSRVAFLIGTGMAAPEEILAVTFTNKAAREMLERLGHLGVAAKGMWVGTFHGLCNRFLRKFHKAAGLPPSFQILDVDDSKAVLKRLYKAKGWSEERLPPKDAYNFIAEKKEEGLLPAGLGRMASARDQLLRDVFEAYEEQLQSEGAVDFPGLMLKTVNILQDSPDARLWFQERFRHVLIDEFQDTNKLQYRWLKLITGVSNPVFAVGDGDQSVYGFRGANVENIEAFVSEFGLSEESVVRMEQNYRSRGNILRAANAVIKNNPKRMDKNLWTDKEDGRLIHLKQAMDGEEEAGFLADEAQRAKEDGASLSEVAFLYRTNAQSRALEHALFRRGMPYRVYGGLRFFERAEIKNAMGYLRLAANKQDDSALLRVINFPARGIGAKTISKYIAAAEAGKTGLWEAVEAGASKEAPKLKAALGAFMEKIERIGQMAQSMPLPALMQGMLEESGLLEFYKTGEQAQDRTENLMELANAAKGFVSDPISEDVGLEAFLAHAALEAGQHGADEGEEAVQLMTVHASKGLEFDHVFIAGMEEGIFPHANTLPSEKDVQEERRLMYVAITRARKELTLSFAVERSQFGKFESNKPSRFLTEMPEELLMPLQSDRSEHEVISAQIKAAARDRGGYRQGSGPARKADFGDTGKGAGAIAAKIFNDPKDPLAVGKMVKHAKFGEGRIKAREGQGEDLAVVVDFGAHGTRRLIVKYAKFALA